MFSSKSRITTVLFAISLCGPISAQATQRVSVGSGGAEGNFDSYTWSGSISADGRFVAFTSFATNFVVGDTNGYRDAFVHDRQSGTTERVSVAAGGVQGNEISLVPSISADGRFVAFTSLASNLIAGDTNPTYDIFVRDRQSGTTERVSVGTGGVEANDRSDVPRISADGRFVAFLGRATNLVAGDTNGAADAFVHDRQSGTTERVSVATGGAEGNAECGYPSISADGRFVTFPSQASNLVAGDTNANSDTFVRDRQSGTTERVSVATGGAEGNAGSGNSSISADGRFVAFVSTASNLVAGDTNASPDILVRDRQSGTTERVSVATGGAEGDGQSLETSISADGRFVAFASQATNLVAGDTNLQPDIFVRDRQSGTTERVSVATGGAQGNVFSQFPSISADGRFVAFASYASNLVAGDTNGLEDSFVRDRTAAGFASLCEPGVSGVIACPCSNPPSGPGRGCNNSSATGGAILSASGIAYLSMDSLVFATSGEKPTALSILLQGNGSIPGGVGYGQGVRCLGGAIIRRLFTKAASGGSITVPDFGAGDLTVSARSAVKGDLIQPGQSRWYLVYYRDLVVLGGCDAWRSFNATQTGQVTWQL